MATYSIKDLEKISGIKAHTLRIWEQRYAILKPTRTETNIRCYDDHDLKVILNISMLNCNGYKISTIAAMTRDQIMESVRTLTECNLEFDTQINSLSLAMIELNEVLFEKVFSVNTIRYGFEKTMLHIIYPFFERVGILWQTGSITPAQEHFVSNLTRQKIISAIDGQQVSTDPAAPRWLLFLPEGELHEISLLFSYFLLKSKGNKVVYLGQDVPFTDLIQIHQTYRPDYLLTLLTSRTSIGFEYASKLGNTFPGSTILISGQGLQGITHPLPVNVQCLQCIGDLILLADEYQAKKA